MRLARRGRQVGKFGRKAKVKKAAAGQEAIIEPTPEQRLKATFVEQEVVDVISQTTIRIGRAFRREPRYLTIDGLGDRQLKALKFYRDTFDKGEVSEIGGQLDPAKLMGAGGGGGSGSHVAIERMESVLAARWRIQTIDRQMGAWLDILRDVALRDLSFTDCAILRYGSRQISRIYTGPDESRPRNYVTIEPKSATHRQMVREDFMFAVARLAELVARYL